MALAAQALPAPDATDLAPKKREFKPNFFHDYSVVLDKPIEEVFRVIGTNEGHERVSRLSGLCTDFKLETKDLVSLPSSSSLAQSHVGESPASVDGEKQLPRQFFKMTETVPILFGITTDVHLSGTLTWDENASPRLALYETKSDNGIEVWKLRTFEEVEGGKTKVSEKIEGVCNFLLKPIVQGETAKSHKAHMDAYQSLFN